MKKTILLIALFLCTIPVFSADYIVYEKSGINDSGDFYLMLFKENTAESSVFISMVSREKETDYIGTMMIVEDGSYYTVSSDYWFPSNNNILETLVFTINISKETSDYDVVFQKYPDGHTIFRFPNDEKGIEMIKSIVDALLIDKKVILNLITSYNNNGEVDIKKFDTLVFGINDDTSEILREFNLFLKYLF